MTGSAADLIDAYQNQDLRPSRKSFPFALRRYRGCSLQTRRVGHKVFLCRRTLPSGGKILGRPNRACCFDLPRGEGPPCQGAHLIFLKLESVELAVAWVAARVTPGGHNVPEPVIRRRFAQGWRNFTEMYRQLVDSWDVYDNPGGIVTLLEGGVAHEPER